MKKLVIILGLFIFLNINSLKVHAEEVTLPVQSQEFIYDMVQGGTQQFESFSPEGDQLIIEVSETPNYLRAVNNGNYTIAASAPGHWKASYQITVNNNKITRAYSPSSIAYTGAFTGVNLKLDSPIQSTYYMKRKFALLTTSINLRAKLLSNHISITH